MNELQLQHECSSKRQKKRTGEADSGSVTEKRMKKTWKEEEEDGNREKHKDMNVGGDAEGRKILEATEDKFDDVELGVVGGVVQGATTIMDLSVRKKKRGAHEADLVYGRRFTKEEDEIIEKAVLDYVDENQLGEKGVHMVMNSRSHPNVRGCWKEISQCLPQRHWKSVYHRGQCIFNRGDCRKWTEEEINYIKEMREKHGPDWKSVGIRLGRYWIHVKDMYRFTKLTNLKKGSWSQDEYESLFDLVHTYLEAKILEETMMTKSSRRHEMLRDNICWDAVSDKLGTRDHSSCCRKWYRGLSSSMVQDGTWADADDYRMLIELYKFDANCEEEVDWDSLIEHSTGDLCR